MTDVNRNPIYRHKSRHTIPDGYMWNVVYKEVLEMQFVVVILQYVPSNTHTPVHQAWGSNQYVGITVSTRWVKSPYVGIVIGTFFSLYQEKYMKILLLDPMSSVG